MAKWLQQGKLKNKKASRQIAFMVWFRVLIVKKENIGTLFVI